MVLVLSALGGAPVLSSRIMGSFAGLCGLPSRVLAKMPPFSGIKGTPGYEEDAAHRNQHTETSPQKPAHRNQPTETTRRRWNFRSHTHRQI